MMLSYCHPTVLLTIPFVGERNMLRETAQLSLPQRQDSRTHKENQEGWRREPLQVPRQFTFNGLQLR